MIPEDEEISAIGIITPLHIKTAIIQVMLIV